MRRHTKFIWCILAAMLFCAVSYGGCGGSSNMADPVKYTDGDSSQTVSGDTSGRGDLVDWEVLSMDDDPWETIDSFFRLRRLMENC